jgi:hypothetical protein
MITYGILRVNPEKFTRKNLQIDTIRAVLPGGEQVYLRGRCGGKKKKRDSGTEPLFGCSANGNLSV